MLSESTNGIERAKLSESTKEAEQAINDASDQLDDPEDRSRLRARRRADRARRRAAGTGLSWRSGRLMTRPRPMKGRYVNGGIGPSAVPAVRHTRGQLLMVEQRQLTDEMVPKAARCSRR